MTSEDSVSAWIEEVNAGSSEAAQRIWTRYFERLTHVARRKLSQRRVSDEEDVVSSAFEAFLRGVDSGRFKQLDSRQDLWQILVVLTERRAIDQTRADLADKRGGGKVRGESVFGGDESEFRGLDAQACPEPPPEFELELQEQVRARYAQLGDEKLESIAKQRLEGYANSEIARNLNVSVSSVERKLRLIREIWGDVSNVE